jgi:hypothetical protein
MQQDDECGMPRMPSSGASLDDLRSFSTASTDTAW